jgi:hypothetical protein
MVQIQGLRGICACLMCEKWLNNAIWIAAAGCIDQQCHTVRGSTAEGCVLCINVAMA